MKNNLFTRFGITWLICFCAVWMQAQETANVGELRNGVATLTDLKLATKVLKANLSATAQVSDVKLEFEKYDSKYYLTSSVTNDPVSSIGIQLHQNGNILFAMAGPGIEITCTGFKCNDCKLNWAFPRASCKCYDSNPSSETRCDMTSKVTIGL